MSSVPCGLVPPTRQGQTLALTPCCGPASRPLLQHTDGMAVASRLLAAVALVLLAACSLPVDPQGTLDDIQSSGTLRVGVSPNPPFTVWPEDPGAEPDGSEVQLVRGFAESLGADPIWVTRGEQELAHALERGELDLLIGGLRAETPWTSMVTITRPYVTTSEDGRNVPHVIAVVPGENALLVALERYLDGAQG